MMPPPPVPAPERVRDPAYWRARLAACGGDLHRAMFAGSADQMAKVNDWHRRELAAEIRPGDSVLDAGCGYGRLLTLMPAEWRGDYVGVDITPEFVAIAEILHPSREFLVADAAALPWPGPAFDVAVAAGMRSMLREHCGEGAWRGVEAELSRVCRRVLVLGNPKFD